MTLGTYSSKATRALSSGPRMTDQLASLGAESVILISFHRAVDEVTILPLSRTTVYPFGRDSSCGGKSRRAATLTLIISVCAICHLELLPQQAQSSVIGKVGINYPR